MSVLRKKRKSALGELNLASTADISFLLLIFFIVTTIFAEEQGLIMILPGKARDKTDIQKVAERNIATLRIHADNGITLDRRSIELRAIKGTIEGRITANDKLVVVLETHPDAHYGVMVSVLDELKLANARKLTLRTAKG
jgi:biopolymer transport protein ExbD